MNNILVTGATGFIGSNLVNRLRNDAIEFTAIDSSSGDIENTSTWARLPAAKIVVHLAAKTFVPESWKNPDGFMRTNLNGTHCALEYCRANSARLVYLSSYMYGTPTKLPIDEKAPVLANNPYALSKKQAEECCAFYATHYGVKTTILRPFNIYGPNQDSRFLIPTIVQQVRRQETIRVMDLEPKRDYLYIDDLVEAIVCATKMPQNYELINIASGKSYSVGEIIEAIQHAAGSKLPVIASNERRANEIMDTRGDISKARDLLKWQPKLSLEEGCARLLGHIK